MLLGAISVSIVLVRWHFGTCIYSSHMLLYRRVFINVLGDRKRYNPIILSGSNPCLGSSRSHAGKCTLRKFESP